MLALSLDTPQEIAQKIAVQAKESRLALAMTQEELARRSGVSLSSIKRFERTGQISLASLLQLALVLDALDPFKTLFTQGEALPATLDLLLKQTPKRQRGRRK
ncbi:MAG: helix-turn-helix transcriptional regulator [Anaerolineae bacterium]|nr:helix-turn-helix transcriptional regulator [Gloeobacterales cyanobacterium ES-bin-313]